MHGINAHCAQRGGLFTIFFGEGPIRNLPDAKRCNAARYARFFHHLLGRGIYLPPSQFEVSFISAAHTDDDVTRLIEAANWSAGIPLTNE
jgi:glutamate-1-semialdehyde 2,1-aminomutase